MNTAPPLLHLSGISVAFPNGVGDLQRAVEGVDLKISRSEIVGLIGASGSGKSLTALAALGLTPPKGSLIGGKVFLDQEDLAKLPEARLNRIRGGTIALLFQEAEAALNPVISIGAHFKEVIQTHRSDASKNWREDACNLLESVGLEGPRILKSYAHQLSGGQRQRVLLAMTMAGEPDLLVADEPTSSLDVLTQARILRLLEEECRKRGMALLLISHDLAVVAGIADRIVVMFAGQIVEEAPTEDLFENPLHPYTRMLVAVARNGASENGPTGGRPPSTPAKGCRYSHLCPKAEASCFDSAPSLAETDKGRRVRCPVVVAERNR
ncbi:MAG: ABC transporter ATP-binding protein [Thermoanaerobaculales bacterium]|nr:ABC transporter ATP-binding protein [Thermoanaerobaculales bacterium]